MTNSIMNARNADSDLMINHRFPWKWELKDLEAVEKNGLKVFSCFSCGGGSSMGYKLAGYEVIGNCEIDPRVIEVYRKNNHPKLSYLCDIRELTNQDLPDEMYHLDILDGSPPCSVFSMAGEREVGWGKEKVFREGQAKQRLDDLFFAFIDVARKLQPKAVIAENVKGLIGGNAKGYVNEIIKDFDDAGYKVQIFLFNAGTMGVPQARERVFFIAHRKDLDLPKLKMSFNEPPILFKEIREENGRDMRDGSKLAELIKYRREGDTKISHIYKRINGKNIGFTSPIISDCKVSQTITSGGTFLRMYDGKAMTDSDFRNAQSFPQDYDFEPESAQYICGMSVPPVMMAQISAKVYEQWFGDGVNGKA